MRYYLPLLLLFLCLVVDADAQSAKRPLTFCNPLDLPYRFRLDGSQREAADPVIVLYKNNYWLFASKTGGYWHSTDLMHWTLTEPEGLPLEHYAPAIAVIRGQFYFLAGNALYTTIDPAAGKWTKLVTYPHGFDDPALFEDTDGRIYLYHGCKENKPLQVAELDAQTFQLKAEQETVRANNSLHGWEVAGETNTGKKPGDTAYKNLAPWVEGSWMNKINGTYYLQYAAPGTQFKSYADGVFTSHSPTGPFTYQTYSPFSAKPTGFVTGTGHSATFADRNNQYWHITTVALSVRHSFERRLALFSTGIKKGNQLVTNTYLGDYPQLAPGLAKNPVQNNLAGWMLLSYNKPATASSTLAPASKQVFDLPNAFDEEIKTWWSAATGNAGEWLQVDLTRSCRIEALQLNFADQDATALGRLRNDGYQYYIETSADGKKWNMLYDRRDSARDEPHHYIQLTRPATARYVRITNKHMPAGSLFSFYDLRIFGSAQGSLPAPVKTVIVNRTATDRREVQLSWPASTGADFYVVRYGIAPDRLFSNIQVYKAAEVNMHSLNAEQAYYFTVDAVNGSGISQGTKVIKAE
jgi:hypothetical protein